MLDETTTEDDGRFAFFNVRPAQYRLTAKRQGYVRSSPMTVTVSANQARSEVRLPMTPAATIYGVVYDKKGAPFGNILVQAFKASYQTGQRALKPVESVRANDLGEYRHFWLSARTVLHCRHPAGCRAHEFANGANGRHWHGVAGGEQ